MKAKAQLDPAVPLWGMKTRGFSTFSVFGSIGEVFPILGYPSLTKHYSNIQQPETIGFKGLIGFEASNMNISQQQW